VVSVQKPVRVSTVVGMGYSTASVSFSQRSASRASTGFITYFLMAVNIVLFIIMELSGGTEDPNTLIRFGAKINSLIIKGQYWRFLTSAFIHIGLPHIAFNMYGLFNIGSLVESLYGHKKYVFIYLSAALWGSASSFVFSTIPSAGASGAIFGLFGALLYLGRKIPGLFSTSFGINILVVLGFNLFYGFTNTGIDNYAHIGGLIGGYMAASGAGLKFEKRHDTKHLAIIALSIIIFISGVFYGIKSNTTSWRYYYELSVESYESGNLVRSEEYLKTAVSLNPKSSEAHALLSLVYYRQGIEEHGKDEYKKAISLDSDQPDLYFNLGNLFFKNKRYAEAEDMFKKFVEIRPTHYEGYLNLGVTLNIAGKHDEAETNLKKAVEIAPNEFLTNVNLGYMYIDKKDYSNAKIYIEKASQLKPSDEEVKKTLTFLSQNGY